MKLCPTCQRRYSDDTLNFCLEDGAPLNSASGFSYGETLTLDASQPPPTEILDPAIAPTVRAHRPASTVRHEARPTREEIQDTIAPAAKPRNTSSVVALTVAATVLLLGLGGLGAWFFLKDKNGEGNINGVRAGTDPPRVGNSNTGTLNTNAVDARIAEMNEEARGVIASMTPTPLPTPTAQPTTQTNGVSSAREEVSNALNGWRRTMVNPDVDAHMSYYADVLHTYYNAKNVGVSRVRANVARAFSSYSTFDVQITNLQIEVDPSGQKAFATFDKTFEFSRSDKKYSGSGLNRFWFEKIGGRWLITGEKDLKTHYVNN